MRTNAEFYMYAEYTAQKLSPAAPQRQNWILYYVQPVQKGNKSDLGTNKNMPEIMWSKPPLFLLVDKSQVEHHKSREMMGFFKGLMQE